MTIRRLMYLWLIPAAIVLPLVLIASWALFDADRSLWGLLPAAIVLIVQVIATVLVRMRHSARASRAVSPADAVTFAVWHVLIILGGFLPAPVSARLIDVATVVGVAVLAVTAIELWREGGHARTAGSESSVESVREAAEAARDATKNESLTGWRGGTGSTW